MAYNVRANNKTSRRRALYALYIGPNDDSAGYSVLKLSTKKMIIALKCKPVPMPDNVIDTVNKKGEQEGMPNKIHFCNIHKESTVDDLYGDIDSQDDSSCVSDED